MGQGDRGINGKMREMENRAETPNIGQYTVAEQTMTLNLDCKLVALRTDTAAL